MTPGNPAATPCTVDPAEEFRDQSGIKGVIETAPIGGPALDGADRATLAATGAGVRPWLLA